MADDGRAVRVLAVCGDAGGAAALAPVVLKLREHPDVHVELWAYGPGVEVMRARMIKANVISAGADANALDAIWSSFDPDVLLAASSVNEYEFEKKFTRLARSRRVPSLVVVDSWTSYGTRFGPRAGEFDALPDLIAVPDSRSREEWIAAGVSEERLVVTGQPAFDALAEIKDSFSAERRAQVRESLGVKTGEWLAVFLSQPIRQLTKSENARYIFPGYDQYDVFSRLVELLHREASARRRPGVLVVRPHPRETEAPDAQPGREVRIVHDRLLDVRETMLASDLVIGMASIALVEACYLGCPALSLQPGALYPEAVASNIAGVSASVRTWAEFGEMTTRMMFDDTLRSEYAERLKTFAVDGKASERVVSLVFNMAGKAIA